MRPATGKSVAAPATVSGEFSFRMGPWAGPATGKPGRRERERRTASQETCHPPGLAPSGGTLMGQGRSPARHTEGEMSRLVSVLGTNSSLAAERVSAAIVAALLGLFILYGVGFAHMSHETAHDTRHATGFPCH